MKGNLSAMEAVIASVIGLLFVALSLGLSGLCAMWLWNALVPALCHGPHITFFQGLLIAAALSFVGGFFKNASASK